MSRNRKKNENEALEILLTVRLTKEQNQFLLECADFDDLKRGDVVRAFIDSFIHKNPNSSKRGSSSNQAISNSMDVLIQLNSELEGIRALIENNKNSYLRELRKLNSYSKKPQIKM